MLKKLIITADDYGMSESVNEAIRECVSVGIVTSTNLMTGMDYCESIVQLKQDFPTLSVGLHWTLTTCRPVSEVSSIPSLVDENGMFWSYADFRKRYKHRQINREEMINELSLQYNRFVALCGEPDYWNTHQNIHVGFEIVDLFLTLANDLNIKKMRSHQRIDVPSQGRINIPRWQLFLEPVKRAVLNSWMSKAKSKGINAPDGLLFFMESEDKLKADYVYKHIRWKGKSIAELIIHPASKNDCPYFGSISGKRIAEFNYFRNPQLRRLATEEGILLCGFEEV